MTSEEREDIAQKKIGQGSDMCCSVLCGLVMRILRE